MELSIILLLVLPVVCFILLRLFQSLSQNLVPEVEPVAPLLEDEVKPKGNKKPKAKPIQKEEQKKETLQEQKEEGTSIKKLLQISKKKKSGSQPDP